MTAFSPAFLEALIIGSLALTGLAALTLVVMVLVDFLRQRIW